MTYAEAFDRLGNPRTPPEPAQAELPDWQHRVIRWASGLTIAACLFILIWVR